MRSIPQERAQEKEAKEVRVCPRCGRTVSYYKDRRQGDRVYVYAVHYVDRKKKECYLGPREGYVYVTKLHEREGLVFRGYIDSSRALEYLDAIIEYVAKTEIDPGTKQEMLNKVKRLLRALKVRWVFA